MLWSFQQNIHVFSTRKKKEKNYPTNRRELGALHQFFFLFQHTETNNVVKSVTENQQQNETAGRARTENEYLRMYSLHHHSLSTQIIICSCTFSLHHHSLSIHISVLVLFSLHHHSLSTQIIICSCTFFLHHHSLSTQIIICSCTFSLHHHSLSTQIIICSCTFSLHHHSLSIHISVLVLSLHHHSLSTQIIICSCTFFTSPLTEYSHICSCTFS